MINFRYLVKNKIGEGRSKVFRIEDKFFPEQPLAIKVLSSSANYQEKELFEREFEILQNLDHPGIIKCYSRQIVEYSDESDNEIDIQNGDHFLVLEYFPGDDLNKSCGYLSSENLINIACQIADILFYLHLNNYIYFDVKAENILLKVDLSGLKIKFVDFGMTEFNPTILDYSVRGSIEYLAPEIITGTLYDFKVDLYSLGILLYKISTGNYPFRELERVDILNWHLNSDYIPENQKLPPKFYKLIQKLVSKEPVERPQSVLEVIITLLGTIPAEMKQHWRISGKFKNRKSFYEVCNNFLDGEQKYNVILIRGKSEFEKRKLLPEIYLNRTDTLFLDCSIDSDIINAYRVIAHQLVFSVKTNSSKLLFKELPELFDKQVNDAVKAGLILTNLFRRLDNNLIISNLDSAPRFLAETLRNLILISSINGLRIIIDTEKESFVSGLQSETHVYNLLPYDESEITQYVKENLNEFIHPESLGVLISKSGAQYPDEFNYLFFELLTHGYISISDSSFTLADSADLIEMFRNRKADFFNSKISMLSFGANRLLKTISILKSKFSTTELISFGLINEGNRETIFTELFEANLIFEDAGKNRLMLSSGVIADLLREQISRDFELIEEIASAAAEHQFMSYKEIGDLYMIAVNPKKAYSYYKEETERLSRINESVYKSEFLEEILKKVPDQSNEAFIRFELFKVYSAQNKLEKAKEMGEWCLNTFHSDSSELITVKKQLILIYIRLRLPEKSITLVEELCGIDQNFRHLGATKLFRAEIALDKEDLVSADNLCREVIEDDNSALEDKGNAYNLAGIIKYYSGAPFESVVYDFSRSIEIFSSEGNYERKSSIEVNLGNIFSIRGEFEKSKNYWDEALKSNERTGDLNQQANILMNLGIYYLNLASLEEANEKLATAGKIFSAMGDSYGFALGLINLAETHYYNCMWENSLDELRRAERICLDLSEYREIPLIKYFMAANYFRIGEISASENIVEDFFNDSPEKDVRVKAKYIYLRHELAYEKEKDIDREELVSAVKILSESGDHFDCFFALLLLISYNIKLTDFSAAQSLLNEYSNLFKNNEMFAAGEHFLTGELRQNNSLLKEGSSLDEYLKAFHIVENLSINEMTLKIIFAIGNDYFHRGAYRKAEEYYNYVKELLKIMAGKTGNERSVKKFRLKKDISSMIEQLKYFEQTIES